MILSVFRHHQQRRLHRGSFAPIFLMLAIDCFPSKEEKNPAIIVKKKLKFASRTVKLYIKAVFVSKCIECSHLKIIIRKSNGKLKEVSSFIKYSIAITL